MKITPLSQKQNHFFDAIENNNIPIVREFVVDGFDINVRDKGGSTALMRSSFHAYAELVTLLIRAGADVNLYDKIGYTALHYAAQEYHVEIAKKLIEAGANVDSLDIHGNTPLFKAVFYSKNRGAMIQLLRQNGANDNLSNKYGATPLSLAQTIANYDAIQFFK